MTGTSELLFPMLKWAQRSEYVLLTVDVQDSAEVVVNLKEEGQVLCFSCAVPNTGQRYACELKLYRAVSSEESQHVARPRGIELKLKKVSATRTDSAEVDAEDVAWPRLTLEKAKHKCIQVDWARWRDEDDDSDNQGDDLGDFGMGGESGIDYSKMMSQFMVKQGHEDSTDMGGAAIPEFGSAQNQEAIAEDDDDDMPPLENE